jgi:MFS family permease
MVSVTGTWMQVVAQNWLVFRLTGEAAAVGITVALQALPSVLFGILGGIVADRVSKRRVVVVTELMLATLAVGLGIITIAGVATIGTVYCFALLLGLVMAVDGPSTGALGAELVPEADLGNAIALGSVVNGLGRILGMSIAGVLVATAGAGPIFLLNGVSYLAVVFVVARLPVHAPRARRADRSERSSTRHIGRAPVIAAAAAVAFFVSAFGRNYQVTMAAMAKTTYNAGAGGYGTLSVVFAVGALVGGVVAARVRHHRLQLVVGAAVAGSLLQLAGAFMPTFASFAVTIFQIAIVAVVFDTITSCVVQHAAGDAFRGRAIAALGTVSMLGVTIGGPTLGWLADHFGPRASLQYGASLVLLGTAVVASVHLARGASVRARVVELWTARGDRAVVDAAA